MVIFKFLIIICVISVVLSFTQVKTKVIKFSFNDIAEMSDKEIENTCERYPKLAFKIKVLRGIHNITKKFNGQVDQFFDNINSLDAKNILALELYINSTKALIREHLLNKVSPKSFKKSCFQSDKAWFFKTIDKKQLALIYTSIELIDKLLDGEDLLKIDVEPLYNRHYSNILKLKI